MHYLLTEKDAAPPAGYSEMGAQAPVPGADWFIKGRRYRETAREQIENGYRLTLDRADADPGLGYMALKES